MSDQSNVSTKFADDAIEMSDDEADDDEDDESMGEVDSVKVKPSTQGRKGSTTTSFPEKAASMPAAGRSVLASRFNPTALSGFEFVQNDEETCVPLYMMNTYTSSNLITHVVVVMVLPSGIGYKTSNNISLHLDKNSSELVIDIKWPDFVTELDFLNLFPEDHITSDDFVLAKQALKIRMSQMRPTIKDPLKSVARIPLMGYSVRPIIEDGDWCFLGELTGTRVLYIDLKTPTDGKYEGHKVKRCMIQGIVKE